MKKVIFIMMLAGSASLLQACDAGNSSKDAVDSVKNIEAPNPIDTSKTTTELGGATVVDNSASGGTTMIKGRASSKTTMETPASTAAKTDTAGEAHQDSLKTKL
ncbi:hypothetical protein KHS38_03335 [Mucilaginibacter sp. Bleaf8]|uniref:hypothetical protein n=1 Tax=Mucilaginibacter sp. Bleaf8 TaxID=2834430 RepID=UPI001BD1B793|nr:hypothetical protein [Mucilaginibacter sp. Bleaf8]MBS7563427.1 hypothetical protein [Mucilaginibacter sp. Bleaf8]